MNDIPDCRQAPTARSGEALRIHRAGLLIDGHNDLPDKLRGAAGSSLDQLDISRPQPQWHTDIPRLREGGVGAQFWSAYVPSETDRTGGAARYALEQIDLIHDMAARYPEHFEMAYTAEDIERIRRDGRIACLIGLEGGHAIENSLGVLRMFGRLGVRYITLTHVDTHDWADSATDQPRHGGLTPFGEQVVREMNRLGILVDISHASVETMHDALRVSRAPVIASHSSAFALAPHPRNIPDDVLELIRANRGVVMVNFYSGFLTAEGARASAELFAEFRTIRQEHQDPQDFENALTDWRRAHPIPPGTLADVVDHIEHIARIAGVECVGLGSDFDGVNQLPELLQDVSAFPLITQELLERGYSESDIHRIMGGNILNALRRAEYVARHWDE